MNKSSEHNHVSAALQYLRKDGQFFEFDNQECVVRVCISDTESADELAAHVGHLRDLKQLRFAAANLTNEGLRHLAGLVRLQEFYIDRADLSRITSAGLEHLRGMAALEHLYIEDARALDLAAFECIARLSSLRKLTLENGLFSDVDLAPLAALSRLEELSLTDCNQLQGTFCRELVELPRLRRIAFGDIGGQITDEGLASIALLSGLSSLDVTGKFTDRGLAHLIALHNLTWLVVESEHVTAQGVAVVVELPKLAQLYFDTPNVYDDAIPALLRCTALECLTFRRSQLSDAGLQRLRDELPKCSVTDSERDRTEFGPWVDPNDAERWQFDETTPFLTLLAKAGDFDLIEGTSHKIGDRYGHWVDAIQYTPEERVIMLVLRSSGIIDNGGFEYLFAGDVLGDPDYHITAETYKTAGLHRGYEAFQEAFALFPGGQVPHDRANRIQLYHATNQSARDRLNRKLWQDGRDGSREKQLGEFIRKNAAKLGDLDAT